MTPQDWFVATAAVGVGVFLVSASFCNTEWCYEMSAAQSIEGRWGRSAARGYYAILGVAMIGVGVYIAATESRRPVPKKPTQIEVDR